MLASNYAIKEKLLSQKCEANSNHVIGRFSNWIVLSGDLQEGHKHIFIVKLVAEYKFAKNTKEQFTRHSKLTAKSVSL